MRNLTEKKVRGPTIIYINIYIICVQSACPCDPSLSSSLFLSLLKRARAKESEGQREVDEVKKKKKKEGEGEKTACDGCEATHRPFR